MSIHDILYTPAKSHPKGEFVIENLYKTRFFVVGIMPDNLLEICQLFCKRCFNTFSFKKFMKATPTCTTCSDAQSDLYAPTELEPIFLAQFFIKDKSILSNVDP
jgi:hypothetical protein